MRDRANCESTQNQSPTADRDVRFDRSHLASISVPEVEGSHKIRVVLLHASGPLSQLSGLQRMDINRYFKKMFILLRASKSDPCSLKQS